MLVKVTQSEKLNDKFFNILYHKHLYLPKFQFYIKLFRI